MSRKSVRIPKGISQVQSDVIYLDESGVADLNDKQTKHFILTGVFAEKDSFEKYNSYYCQLKYKYLKENIGLHAYDLFHNPGKYDQQFIFEFASFIDALPFGFCTVSINKNKIINDAQKRKIKRPLEASFNRAITIYLEEGGKKEDFYTEKVSTIVKKISQYRMENVNRFYALKITYEEIIKRYLSDYTENINQECKPFEICFEDGSNKERILVLTEKFKQVDDSFGILLKENLSEISFPNKKAKYLGLELADVISFGFNLSLNGKLDSNDSYKIIWEAINRRRIEFKDKKSIDMFIKL